ncbi:MAG: hypothetical protein AB1515_00375 [Nitrospirota bacterium]
MPIDPKRKWRQRSTLLLLTLGLGFLEIGCTISQRYVISVPNVQGSGLTLAKDSITQAQRHIIELPGLQLSVKPFNARLVSTFNTMFLFIPLPIRTTYPYAERFSKMDQSADPPFLIELAFNPQGGTLSLDLAQTVLSLAERDYRPTHMIVPSEFTPMRSFGDLYYQGLNLCSLPYNVRWEAKLQPLQPIQVPAGEKACIWLSFDLAPPLPETEFTVSLGGVEMAGKFTQVPSIRFIVPPIRFIKGIAYYIDSIP